LLHLLCDQIHEGLQDTVRKLIVFLLGFAAFAVAYILYAVWQNDFPFSLMDLDDNGFVSPSEFIGSFDLGYRQVIGQGRNCIEIYYLKDGLERKVVCAAR
jgi:hypothetical protein